MGRRREGEGGKGKGREGMGRDVAPSNENFCLRPCVVVTGLEFLKEFGLSNVYLARDW